MSWRTVVVSKRAKLELKLGYVVIRSEEDMRKIYASEISTLIVESTAVSLTAALMAELVRQKVKIIFCDELRNPLCECVPYYGCHDSSAKIRSQINWGADIKNAVWTEIVTEKIQKQCDLLAWLGKNENELLAKYITEIEPGDVSNREGHAAKVYFNALFGLDFSRAADIPVNAALNYGYSILLSYFNREIASCGYLTQIGLCHDNMFNQFNLSSDMMEIFRPVVDRHVYSMMPQKFEHDEKIMLLGILNDDVIIDGQRQCVSNAIKIYCKSVFEALSERDISLLRFYRNEL